MTTAPAPAATPPALPPAPEGMVNVFVDGVLLHVKKGSTVMQACTQAAKQIPHFCYHERLSIAGNCRMCLVEIEGAPKPVASCHWPVAEGMKVKTDSKITQEARKGTMEMLLINHPLDCPICDQGGECELQDQAVAFGADRSHYNEFKRAVDDLDIGSKIKTVMTRCIHCTRCVRFATEIAGVEEFGATGRGENMKVGTYVQQALQSELAGNMIDLCPVGALTSKPYAYTARPWELVRTSSVDVLDAIGAPVHVDTRAGQVMRVLPQEDAAINEEWLTDSARFSYDALHTNRLTTPLIKGQPATWAEAFSFIAKAHHGVSGAHIGAVFGNLESAETLYSAQQFLQQNLGVTQLSCLPGSRAGGLPFTFATPLAGFEQADAILLLGCNPRQEAPLLNIRLRRAATRRRVPVAALGGTPNMDLTYPYQNLGESPKTLAELVSGKHPFAATLKAAKAPQVIVSAQLLNRPDAAAILAQAAQLGALNVLEDTCGRITAQAIGLHTSPTAKIMLAYEKAELNILWVHGDDTITAADLTARKSGGTSIYLGTHLTPLAQAATVVLPTAAWSEQNGFYLNAEGRLQEALAATQPPLQAKESWKIYRALSEHLGPVLPFNTFGQLRHQLGTHRTVFGQPNLKQIAQPVTPVSSLSAGKLGADSFAQPALQYYLRNEYLKQSNTMQAMQAEHGHAKIKQAA